MKLLIFLLSFLGFQAVAQDTLLAVGERRYENNELIGTSSNEYNSQYLPIHSLSVNYKRNDTTEVYTSYDSKNRVIMSVVNGPYFRDKWDTTCYAYSLDTTIMTQESKNYQRIRKTDSLNRSHYFSSKSFNETGRLIVHRVDSSFYNDDTYTQTSRSYVMEDYPKPERTHEVNPDGEYFIIEELVVEKTDEEKGLKLRGSTLIQRDEHGLGVKLVIRHRGDAHCVGNYTHDTLGRPLTVDVNNVYEKTHSLTEYEYSVDGDTLITNSWRTDFTGDSTRVKMKTRKELHSNTEHIHPWDQVFSDDELVAEYFKLYDDKILMGIVHRRKVKGKCALTV